MKKLALVLLLSTLLATSAFAVVKPNGLFSDNAVLQQGVRLPVWGTADNGEKVTVEIQGQKVSTTAYAGRWMVYLNPLKAGGPYTLKINDQVMKNVLVGEVWLCSGQSNMVWTLAKADNGQAAIEASKDPMLRLYTVPRAQKLQELPHTWSECTPETSPGFSAVAYFMGKHLRETLKVPVGLINSSVGGTPVEAWTSHNALREVSDISSDVRPSYLYNGMIAPLVPYGIRGVAWYQGENSAPHAYEYRTLLPLMIRDWRSAWGEGDFPFLIVQIAPYGKAIMPGSWPELREAQLLTVQRTPKTALVVITDVGAETNVHPTQKEPVGERLAIAARAIAYGEKIEHSGPIYTSMKVDANKAVLSFDHVGGGLVARGGELAGFTVCGEDKKFVNAKAEIVGEKVIVTAPEVTNPIAVRYGWSDWMVVNLWNKAGLPASPFRTDDFDMITKR